MINRKNVKLAVLDHLNQLRKSSFPLTKELLKNVADDLQSKGELTIIDEETIKIIYQCMNEIYVKGNKGVHIKIIESKKKWIRVNRNITDEQVESIRKYYEETKTWSKTKKDQPKLTKEERITLPIVEMNYKFDGLTVIKQGDKFGFKEGDKILIEPKYDTLIEALSKRESIMKFAFLASLENEGVQQ